jgi:hypothetical protein
MKSAFTKLVQIKGVVTLPLYNAIQDTRLARGMRLQDIFEAAFTQYLRSVTVENPAKDMEEGMEKDTASRTLFLAYIERMPRDKVEVLLKAMRFDLLEQKSSRRKNPHTGGSGA